MYRPSMQFLPYTKGNDRVRVFRQACAIDERRSMFRLYGWHDDQRFKATRFDKSKDVQDQRQVWFAGVHADVGGGYPEDESQLSKFPLIWMVNEAVAQGLRIDTPTFNHLAHGAAQRNGRYTYVRPNSDGRLHRSLTWAWKPLENIPKRRSIAGGRAVGDSWGFIFLWRSLE